VLRDLLVLRVRLGHRDRKVRLVLVLALERLQLSQWVRLPLVLLVRQQALPTLEHHRLPFLTSRFHAALMAQVVVAAPLDRL
jgi:hypothetical protein